MKSQPAHFSRQLRQFRKLSKEANQLLNSGQLDRSALVHKEKLVRRLRHLYHQLARFFSVSFLQKVLAGAGFLMGFGLAQGQVTVSFTGPTAGVFGLGTSSSYFLVPELADLDGDGDLDLLTYANYGLFQYYENTGNATGPAFAAPVDLPFGLDSTTSYIFPTAGDLDGDGDLDLIVGSDYGQMDYYQNVGTATAPFFTTPVPEPFGLDSVNALAMPVMVDLDNDGDLDLVVGEYGGNWNYFENTGSSTSPQFAPVLVNPFGLTSSPLFGYPKFVDLDVDGDLDLVASADTADFWYYENTGSAVAPAFAAPVVNPFGLQRGYESIFQAVGDLDGDGDTDVLVGEYGGKWQYYENTTPLVNIKTPMVPDLFQMWPNPTRQEVNIYLSEVRRGVPVRVVLRDMTGRELLVQEYTSISAHRQLEIPLGQFVPGSYMVEVQMGEQRLSKVLLKQ